MLRDARKEVKKANTDGLPEEDRVTIKTDCDIGYKFGYWMGADAIGEEYTFWFRYQHKNKWHTTEISQALIISKEGHIAP